jgi:1,2-diacylglycerol 3-beta-galactosyltransferase
MKRILFLMSDTGGGHRAAAEAISAALEARYPDVCRFELIDVWKHYTPFPFNYSPETYGPTIRWGRPAWWAGYKLTNSRGASKAVMGPMYHALFKNGVKRLISRHGADVIVCVHSVFVRPVLRALSKQTHRPPFVTVVTDLVSTHMWWYDPRVDRCLVPTKAAYRRGLLAGLQPEQLRVTGLPVHPRFTARLMDKREARAALGWDPELPAVLILGGGSGMGPVYRSARAINAKRLGPSKIGSSGPGSTTPDGISLRTSIPTCATCPP